MKNNFQTEKADKIFKFTFKFENPSKSVKNKVKTKTHWNPRKQIAKRMKVATACLTNIIKINANGQYLAYVSILSPY